MKRSLLCAGAAIFMIAAYPPSIISAQEIQDAAAQQFSIQAGAFAIKAQNQMSDNNFAEAVATLGSALAIENLSSFERSSLHRMKGAAHFEMDQLDQAISEFQSSINANGLPPVERAQVEASLAQLLIANGRYKKGDEKLEAWHNAGGKLSQAHLGLLTQAWVEIKAFDRAVPWAKKWFTRAEPRERKHYDLMNFLFNQTGDATAQADILKQMIIRWPDDKELWQGWAGLLASAGDESGAFEVNILMYEKGLLETENELMRLAQYYGYYDIPYWGARLIEDEMGLGRISKSQSNLVKLSDLWRQAREYDRAIPILEKAVDGSNDSQLHAALGEALYNRGDCQKAEAAFVGAMDRGYKPGKAWMLIATCRYERSQVEERPDCATTTAEMRAQSPKYKAQDAALEAFEKVPNGSESRRDAEKWMTFIRAERKAIEDRCEFQRQQREIVCFLEIERAYDSYTVTGVFELSEECRPYQAAYDAEFRKDLPSIQN